MCGVSHNGSHSPRVVANIGAVVAERRVNLWVAEFGMLNLTTPSEGTKELAARARSAVLLLTDSSAQGGSSCFSNA